MRAVLGSYDAADFDRAVALVESMAVAEDEREALRSPVTRIFEAGLAVGLELGSGGGDGELGPEQA
jgi:hypothetical protein